LLNVVQSAEVKNPFILDDAWVAEICTPVPRTAFDPPIILITGVAAEISAEVSEGTELNLLLNVVQSAELKNPSVEVVALAKLICTPDPNAA